MANYDALNRYLRRQTAQELEPSLAEIDNLLTALLPKSAHRPQWRANEPGETSHVQCWAWRDAGYDAFPAVRRERVVFRGSR